MNDRARISLRAIVILLAVSGLLACIVFADGYSRKPTPAENQFNKSILNSIAKALPAGPQGWDKAGTTDVNEDLPFIYSEPNQPFKIEYHAAWQDTKRIQAAQVQFNEELMKLAKQPGFTGKGVEELQQKLEPKDVKVHIDVVVNQGSESIYDKVVQAPAIGGGLVYRSQGKFRPSNGWNEGSLYIFLGNPWKASGGAGGTFVTFTPKKIASSTVVQNITVKICGSDARAANIAQSINWGALNALINK